MDKIVECYENCDQDDIMWHLAQTNFDLQM